MAGVALMAHMALSWLWWRAWFPFGAVGRGCLRGRRGTWGHRPPLCVAGVALADMDVHFPWQAWHLWHWVGARGSRLAPWALRLFARHAWHLATATFTLRGRRGNWRHGRALAWQAWHLMIWTCTLRGRRSTC